ncbi:MAG: M20 family metallopeptidase [Verrucomicrobiota bacterium]
MKSCRELLERMIAFDTVNGALSHKPHPERDLAICLENIAVSWGLATQRCPVSGENFNLFITCESDPHADWLLFDSHIDTVSTEGMDIDPLVAKIQGNRIYGRGTCDTKGSGAAMLWAMRNFAQSETRRFNVGLLFSLDEESGMTGAAAFTRGKLRDLQTCSRIIGIVVGEPTGMRPVVAHGGLVRGKITTCGRSCHSSDPSQGASAISRMVKVIDAFESQYIPSINAAHPLAGRAVTSVNTIRGGSQVNIIPDYCEIEFDRRLMPGESSESVLREIEMFLQTLPEKNSLTLEPTFTLEPLNPTGHGAFLDFVSSALRVRGTDATPIGAPWATNASHYNTQCPAVVLGPGDIAQAHTKDEWLDLAQLDLAAEIYLNLMLSKDS